MTKVNNLKKFHFFILFGKFLLILANVTKRVCARK
jgi:hypothetical protein